MKAHGGIGLAAALGLLLGSGCMRAQSALPGYHSSHQVSGTIRIWGHGSRKDDYIGPLVRAWEEAFQRRQPGIRFENGMLGNASAIGGLYTGAADMALMDRVSWPIENDGFQQVFSRDPVGVTIATGSLDDAHYTPALVMLVQKASPLTSISMVQLDSLYDADRLHRGQPVRTWGDLGVRGAQASRPVHIYGFPIASKEAQFFERAVMGKPDDKWNCSVRMLQTEAQVIDAIGNDPDGVGFATLVHRDPRTRALPIIPLAGGVPIAPTRATIAARNYPLGQPIWIYTRPAPGKTADAKVAEFVRFILSRDGQAIIAKQGSYRPLPAALAKSEMEKMQ